MTSFEYNFIIKHFPTLQRLKTYMSKYHRIFMGLDGERWCTLDNERCLLHWNSLKAVKKIYEQEIKGEEVPVKIGKSFQTYFLRNAYKKEGHLYLPCTFLRKDEQFVIEFEKPSDVSTKAVGPQATLTLLEDIKKDTAYKQLPWKYRNDVFIHDILRIQPAYGRDFWKIRCDMGMVKEFEKWVREETGLIRDDRDYADRGLESVKKIRYYLDEKFREGMHDHLNYYTTSHYRFDPFNVRIELDTIFNAKSEADLEQEKEEDGWTRLGVKMQLWDFTNMKAWTYTHKSWENQVDDNPKPDLETGYELCFYETKHHGAEPQFQLAIVPIGNKGLSGVMKVVSNSELLNNCIPGDSIKKNKILGVVSMTEMKRILMYFSKQQISAWHRWLIKQRQDTIKKAGNEYVA